MQHKFVLELYKSGQRKKANLIKRIVESREKSNCYDETEKWKQACVELILYMLMVTNAATTTYLSNFHHFNVSSSKSNKPAFLLLPSMSRTGMDIWINRSGRNRKDQHQSNIECNFGSDSLGTCGILGLKLSWSHDFIGRNCLAAHNKFKKLSKISHWHWHQAWCKTLKITIIWWLTSKTMQL